MNRTPEPHAPVRVAYQYMGQRKSQPAIPIWAQDGLAVTPEINGDHNRWTVTHVASGWCVVRDVRGKRNALSAARRFLECGDWTRPRTAIVKDQALKSRAIAIRHQLRVEGVID